VRDATPHRGPWPRVAVWQGDVDITVRPANATEILKQWRTLHGLDGAPEAGTSLGPAHRVELWRAPDGTPLIEHHAIAGMGHGVPIAPGAGATDGEAPLGAAAPFILDVGIASTAAIAGFFGLAEAAPRRAAAVQPEAEPQREPEAERPAQPGWIDRIIAVGRDGIAQAVPKAAEAPTTWLKKLLPGEAPKRAEAATPEAPPAGGRMDPGQVIRRALRAAGLLDR
jgi:feruloyl esterase